MERNGGGDPGFSFRTAKDGAVAISRDGRTVTILRGARAQRFLAKAHDAPVAAQQQLMARATGNYKRGNERHATHQSRGSGTSDA